MTPAELLFVLGLCTGFAGNDRYMTIVFCELENRAKQRAQIIPEGLGFDDLNMNIIVIGH